jgi:hypothetical protein
VDQTPNTSTDETDTKKFKTYAISAEEYAKTGGQFHSNTPAGRQTFAVVLLTILESNNNKQPKSTLTHIANLAVAASRDEPLATYLLDKLTTAIIESPADLNTPRFIDVIKEINDNRDANNTMTTMVQSNRSEHQVQLIANAKRTIHQAWQLYKETDNDETLIKIIKKTQAVAMDPSPTNRDECTALREEVSGKESWGKLIAGLMLSVLGLALIVGATLALVASIGISAPISIPAVAVGASVLVAGLASLGAGFSFFNASKDTGLYKQMKQVNEGAEVQSLTPVC